MKLIVLWLMVITDGFCVFQRFGSVKFVFWNQLLFRAVRLCEFCVEVMRFILFFFFLFSSSEQLPAPLPRKAADITRQGTFRSPEQVAHMSGNFIYNSWAFLFFLSSNYWFLWWLSVYCFKFIAGTVESNEVKCFQLQVSIWHSLLHFSQKTLTF